ncbi:MAG TPA: polyprenyl diphosphate synthase [Patescibacteria group bacterium]
MFTKINRTIYEKFPILQTIEKNKFPNHIFIIPDGNGRWAKEHKTFVTSGHKKGFEVAEKIMRELSQIQEIKIVTMWGFSADNWKRSENEIQGLMYIFVEVLRKVLKEFNQTNRKFVHIGRKDRMPKKLLDLIIKAEKDTEGNTGQIMCLALDFSGEDQFIRMIDKARSVDSDIPTTKELVNSLKDAKGLIPSADLLIRTANERRTSDVGWLNGISTELFFIDKLFPDISTNDIIDAIIDFSKRERRFGARTS